MLTRNALIVPKAVAMNMSSLPILPTEKEVEMELGFIVGLVVAVLTWFTMKSSLSLFNWVFIGFILLAVTLTYEAVHVRGTIKRYRRNKLIRRLTSFKARREVRK